MEIVSVFSLSSYDYLSGFLSKNFVFILENFHFALQTMNGRLEAEKVFAIEMSLLLTSASE